MADHLHHHGSRQQSIAVDARIARLVWPTVIMLGMITVVGVLLLWPSGGTHLDDPLQLGADPIDAHVIAIDSVACSFSPADRCRLVRFELTSSALRGEIGVLEETPGSPSTISAGDDIRVLKFNDADGERIYSFYDFQRSRPLLVLVGLFAVAVLTLGRWRGFGALAGLAASLVVLVWFTLPAILDGSNAVTVAVVSAAVIAFIALFLAHGFDLSTAIALISTLASLALTAILASVFVGAAHLTGIADDSSMMLSSLNEGVDARGILLAGIVIGALGVLDDVTVTQVSAVWQLKAVQPELTAVQLVRSAMRIGRDHISSTVNTLVLAYAGATLPLLLLFVEADQGLGNVVTREVVATEIVRTLVGSLGLVASVPIATWLAAIALSPQPLAAEHDDE